MVSNESSDLCYWEEEEDGFCFMIGGRIKGHLNNDKCHQALQQDAKGCHVSFINVPV